MVTLSETNVLRIQALTILIIAHVIILLLPTDDQFKISLSSATMFMAALFIIFRGKSLRKKKQIEKLL